MSPGNPYLRRVFDESISFRLYAEYKNGKSVADLAVLCSRPETWVKERIEAVRLCLERQVHIVLPAPEPPVCPKTVWNAQVWD